MKTLEELATVASVDHIERVVRSLPKQDRILDALLVRLWQPNINIAGLILGKWLQAFPKARYFSTWNSEETCKPFTLVDRADYRKLIIPVVAEDFLLIYVVADKKWFSIEYYTSTYTSPWRIKVNVKHLEKHIRAAQRVVAEKMQPVDQAFWETLIK